MTVYKNMETVSSLLFLRVLLYVLGFIGRTGANTDFDYSIVLRLHSLVLHR